MLLAGLLASYLVLLSVLTQPADEAVNVLLLMGGAVLLCPGFPQGWQPRPGRLWRWVGLALLAEPLHQLRRFLWPVVVLAFLPLMRAIAWLLPLGPLSQATAWLTKQWLTLCGFAAEQQGLYVNLPGGGADELALGRG